MFLDAESNTKSLEILTIHHAFKGIQEMKKLAENFNPFDTETVQKTIRNSKSRAFVLNYRFVRKFHSSGQADDWIINGVQHVSGKSMTLAKFFWKNYHLFFFLLFSAIITMSRIQSQVCIIHFFSRVYFLIQVNFFVIKICLATI